MFGRTRPPGGAGPGRRDNRGGFGGAGGGRDDRGRRPPPDRDSRPSGGGRNDRDDYAGGRERGARPPFAGGRPPFNRSQESGGGGPRFEDDRQPSRYGGDSNPRFGGERPRYDGESAAPPRTARPPFTPARQAAVRAVRYQVVTMGDEETGQELERRLNTLGRDGWRLVAIDEGRQYVFVTSEPPAG